MQRFGKAARRKGPHRRGHPHAENRDGLSEGPGVEPSCEQPRCAGSSRDDEDLEQQEERLRGAFPEEMLPPRGQGGYRHLEQGQAHAIGRQRIALGPMHGEDLPPRDTDLAELHDADGRAEDLLLIRDRAERPLVRGSRQNDENDEHAETQGSGCSR